MRTLIIIASICLLILPDLGNAQGIASASFEPIAQVKDELSWIGTRNSTPKIIATIIHSEVAIAYPERKHVLEGNLKKEYDLVLINISGFSYNNGFSIYKFKKAAKLLVDGKQAECVEFYDFEIKSVGYAYYSDEVYDYTADHSANVSGYLLFPKRLNNDTKSVQLTFVTKILSWDYEKLTKLIEILDN